MARPCGKWVVGWSGDTNEDKQGHRQTPVMGYLSLWCTFLGPHSEAAHLNAGQEMGNSLLHNPQAGQCCPGGIRPETQMPRSQRSTEPAKSCYKKKTLCCFVTEQKESCKDSRGLIALKTLYVHIFFHSCHCVHIFPFNLRHSCAAFADFIARCFRRNQVDKENGEAAVSVGRGVARPRRIVPSTALANFFPPRDFHKLRIQSSKICHIFHICV